MWAPRESHGSMRWQFNATRLPVPEPARTVLVGLLLQ